MKKGRHTIHDIARHLNITASTVSRALNNHPRISQATKLAVITAAKKLNYQPNHIAAALRNGKSNIIGVIIPAADRSFFASVVRGIEEVANTAAYNVMICQTYEDPVKEAAAVEVLLNARVDGIIASLSKGTEDYSHFKKITERGIPLVLFDRATDELDVSHVIIDDYLGAYKATKHLIEQGCRRIAHLTSLQKINIYRERLRGYKVALEEHGLHYDEELIIESDLYIEDGRKSTEQLLKLSRLPDAIFSTSDYAAMGALQILKENRIDVPNQIALVGFSNEPFTLFSDPPLTSVNQHSKLMGNTTSEVFLEEIMSPNPEKFIPKKIVLVPELVIRGSSLKKLK